MTITEDLGRFQYLNFEATFLKKPKYRFVVQSTTNESATFPYKTALSKPMLGQIEWGVQNGSIPKNGLLPVTTSFF